jgi:hypothetical protein
MTSSTSTGPRRAGRYALMIASSAVALSTPYYISAGANNGSAYPGIPFTC